MLQSGMVQESRSPWATPDVVVRKKDGSVWNIANLIHALTEMLTPILVLKPLGKPSSSLP